MYIPKVTIGLVLHKGEKYLKPCLASLMSQDYPNIEFLFRDHSPNGEASEYIRQEIPEVLRRARVFKGTNLWHSGGHNALIRKMTGHYYIVCSNDMHYPPDFVSKIVDEMEKPENEHFGSATCKLMVWDFEHMKGTNVIDSCGLGVKRNHHFYDMGQGEADRGQYDSQKEIFGASGALAVYRKSALDDIAYMNDNGLMEYYDSLLHHKNDADLSYRLQWAGHKCLFIPEIKIYHDRQTRNLNQFPSFFVRVLKGRKDKSQWVKEDSFFGQQVVIRKNFSHDYSLLVRMKSKTYSILATGYSLCFEPYLLRVLRNLKEFDMEILKKHKNIKFRVEAKEIEKLMK